MKDHHASATRTDSYRRIALSFFAISLLLLATVAYLFFSWATITITPKAVLINEGFSVEVVDASSGAALESDQLSGKVVTQDLEGSGTFSTKEGTPVIGKTAGAITITNTSSKPQQLRATTRLLNPEGILFRTSEFVTIPAGGRVAVNVVSDREGDLGTLDDSKFTLPGLWPGLQNQIYGFGFEVKTDGAGLVKMVTQKDIDDGIAAVLEKLQEKMKALLEADGSNIQSLTARTKTAQASHRVGDEAEQIDVRVTATVTAVIYTPFELESLVTKKLFAKIGPGYDLLPPRSNDISVTVESVDNENKRATVQVVASAGRVLSHEGLPFNKKVLAGRSPQEITAAISASDEVSDVSVQLYPFWVTRAPFLIDHINILIKKD
ncbi:MAG: hypothetical protein AAB416_02930 [Patescibacteria group bacterium]